MLPGSESQSFANDAFISYSRKDKDFASKLEKTLEDYKPPKELKVPQRNLSVFRDEADFTGVDYEKSIEKHLKNSKKLIVICSPNACNSDYVNDEIRRFAKTRGSDHIIPVLLSGIPNNEVSPGQEDQMAFPEALCQVQKMPLATDYRKFDPKRSKVQKDNYEGSWYTVLANIYDLSRSEIEQRDKKRQIRNRNIIIGIASGIIAILIVFLYVAIRQYQSAEIARRDEQLQRKKASIAADGARLAIARNWLERDPTKAALVLLEIKDPDQIQGADKVMISVLNQPLAVSAFYPLTDSELIALSFDKTGNRVLTASGNHVKVWNANGLGDPLTLEEEGRISSASFSPLGDLVATASGNAARVWNIDGSASGLLLEGHQKPVMEVSFSPAGDHVVTAAWDKTARIWNLAKPDIIVVLTGHEKGVSRARFSPSGEHVLTAPQFGNMRIWNSDGSGEPVVLPAQECGSENARFNSTGDRVITVSSLGGDLSEDFRAVRICTIDGTGRPVALGGPNSTTTAALNPIDNRVLTGAPDGTVRLWNADGLGEPDLYKGHDGMILDLSFSPDGNQFITASIDKTARIWNVGRKDASMILKGHDPWVEHALFSPIGDRVVTAGGGTVRVWPLTTAPQNSILKGHDKGVWKVSFSPDGNYVVSVGADGSRLWDLERSGAPVFFEKTFLAFGPTGKRVLTIADDSASIRNIDNLDKPVILADSQDILPYGAFSPNGEFIAIGSKNGLVRIWKVNNSGKPLILKGHTGMVSSVDFAPDNDRIVTASFDGTVRVWNVDGSALPKILEQGKPGPIFASISPSGKTVVTSSGKAWNIDVAGKPLIFKSQRNKRGDLNHVSFSPSGDRVAVTYSGGAYEANIWNLDSPGKPVVFWLPYSFVNTVLFDPQGKRVAIGSARGIVRVFNADGSGTPVTFDEHTKGIRDHSLAVTDMSFSPSGDRLASASRDGNVRVWLLSPIKLQSTIRSITKVCLTPDFREIELGESPAEALRRFVECERSHHRTPANTASIPSQSPRLPE